MTLYTIVRYASHNDTFGGFLMDYPAKVCPVCAKSFIPKHKRAVYCSNYHRVVQYRRDQRLKNLNPDDRKLLNEIRRKSPSTVRHIEQVIKHHGTECAGLVIKACLVAQAEKAREFVT